MFCFLDVDVDGAREKHSRCHEFVATSWMKYGLTNGDLRHLGGSELARVGDFYGNDHDWKGKGEIVVRREGQGRIVVKLYKDVAPMAVENFVRLCIGKEKDAHLSYLNCKFHRIVPGFVCQSGDIMDKDGSAGMSVFGKKFKDEKAGLNLKHHGRGVLSMGNSGKNSNTSQFFITFDKLAQCDGKHVIFGHVVSGFDVLDEIEKCGTPSGDPAKPVFITGCGEWDPATMPGAGYPMDLYDPESFTGKTPIFMAWLRVAVVVPNDAIKARFEQVISDEQLRGSIITFFPPEEKDRVMAMLVEEFALDVVLIAPACASTFDEFEKNPRILTCKPMNIAKRLQTVANSLPYGNLELMLR